MSKTTDRQKSKQRKRHGDPVALATPDFLAENAEQLRRLMPQVFTEGKIDVEKLRAALGDAADERPERYAFTWAGKRQSILELQKPTWGTLVPAKEESVNFDTTQNIFIEGENLEVLKLLYKPYFGRVKMIYIDPPYNTGGDFVYPDNFADPKDAYLKITGQTTDEGNTRTSNPETSGRYHSAWLSMMYPRLFMARQLLRDDGVIFITIDDHEVHNLRLLMNEIFGEENFVASVIWQKAYSPRNNAPTFSESHDYVLCYAKQAEEAKILRLAATDEQLARYKNRDKDKRGNWKGGDMTVSLISGARGRTFQKTGKGANLYEVVSPSGKKFSPPPGRCWVYSEEKFKELDKDKRVWWGERGDATPALKRFLKEIKGGQVCETIWTFNEVGHNQEASKELSKIFEEAKNAAFPTPKPVRLVQRMLELVTNADGEEVIMDFFCGSGTTAQAVLEQNRKDNGNRRFVLVQFPQRLDLPLKLRRSETLDTVSAVSKERIRRVLSQLAGKKNEELAFGTNGESEDDGFSVFKLCPSNLKPWVNEDQATPESLAKAMELFNDPLLDNWKPENVIYEIALKEGFSLASRIEKDSAVKSNKVYEVTDAEKGQSFRICLDDEVKAATVKELKLDKDDLFVCRDIAINDKTAANLALQCRLKTI